MRPRGKVSGNQQRALIDGWLMAMAATPRPFEEWMRWFWHGHFVSTLRAVGAPALMRNQLRTWAQYGLGDFRSLLRAATVDTAMLVYLDGDTNEVGAVNENYGREVLELFSLGIGHYSEADVRAGATALTGYVRDFTTGLTRFEPARHDDTPQTYLGRHGVHDVDTVVDAIVNHPACGPFIAAKLARAVLGPDVDSGLVTRLAKDFVAGGLQLRPLMRAIVEAGLDGASTPLVAAPVPWAIRMIRATGVPWGRMQQPLTSMLVGAGQVPMDAPNVGGWPGGANWLSASATVARYNLAGWLAYYAPDSDPLRAGRRPSGTGTRWPTGWAGPRGSPHPPPRPWRRCPRDPSTPPATAWRWPWSRPRWCWHDATARLRPWSPEDPMTIPRRTFLGITGGVVAGAAAAAVAGPLIWDDRDRRTGRQPGRPAAARPRRLGIRRTASGSWWWSTWVVATTGSTPWCRPGSAPTTMPGPRWGWPTSSLVALAGTTAYGLNPALAPLQKWWEAKQLVAVDGMAIPDQTRSHFEASDVWWSGDPGRSPRHRLAGPLARHRPRAANPLRAISLGLDNGALTGRRRCPPWWSTPRPSC